MPPSSVLALLPHGPENQPHAEYQPSTLDTALVPIGPRPQLEHEDTDLFEETAVPKQQLNSDMVRVLERCEHLLMGGYDENEQMTALNEIAVLKKRLTRPAETRSAISRHRRYTLGAEARRVLKGWVDKHIDDPCARHCHASFCNARPCCQHIFETRRALLCFSPHH